MGKDKKKTKKHKKEKKHKSKKDKKKKRHYSSSSSSSSSDEWVEKEPCTVSNLTEKPKEREEWMSMEAVFSGKTRKEYNEEKKKDDEEEKLNLLDQPGQSTRELNPFWKDGGTGLPSEEHSSKKALPSKVGDRGAEWLRKALQRAKEQAEEEGRSLESVMAERWGSLDEFKELLKEAESRGRRQDFNPRNRNDSSYNSRYESSDSKYKNRGDTHVLKKLNFKKPDTESFSSDKESRSYHSHSSQRNWRKPGYDDKSKIESESKRKSSDQNESGASKEDTSEKAENKQQLFDDDEDKVLTLNEMNLLCAAMFRAEFSGNMELASELKIKLEKAKDRREQEENKSSTGLVDEKGRNVRMLTETDNRGFSRPVKGNRGDNYSRKRKTETHEGKERVRYFPDDDQHSLQDMFEREKFNSEYEQDATFYKLMKKAGPDEEGAFDNARMDSRGKDDRRNRHQAISKHAARERALDNCRWCIGSKNTSNENIVFCKNKIYLAVPSFMSLTERHCLIVPQHHVSCSTLVDEDVWDEIMELRKTLVRLLEEEDEDIIFFESALYIDRHPHMILHCVPVPKEIGDTAPIYFKKAIMECETEWSNNKKVVELAGRNVRKAVPKGLPYFAVDFGMQSGYAHVIEDKKLFPHNFGQEIIGGMLDLDHTIWRKPKRDSTENIKKKVELLKELFRNKSD